MSADAPNEVSATPCAVARVPSSSTHDVVPEDRDTVPVSVQSHVPAGRVCVVEVVVVVCVLTAGLDEATSSVVNAIGHTPVIRCQPGSVVRFGATMKSPTRA